MLAQLFTTFFDHSQQLESKREEDDEDEIKEQAMAKLQAELVNANEKLKLKDEEVERLSRIRQDVETELEELTASLFQVMIHTADNVM